ncbi:hypothetical protein KIAC18_001442 [Sporomusa sphaeroides]|jgi:hypothetical protein|uniref:hypothetical protein n=1 Tax=Sporomusa sphaeroides TaxID=47679 RepID=UPI003DA06ABB
MKYEAQAGKPKAAAGKAESGNTGNAGGADEQKILPDSQNRQEACGAEEVRQIIDRMLTIAQEIGWLSERKVPVENDNMETAAPVTSRQ